MSVLAFTPSGKGLSEQEIPGYYHLISQAVVRLRCWYKDLELEKCKVSTGFVYNRKGHVISVAHGFPKGCYEVQMAYYSEEFQPATVDLDYDLDCARVIPETPRDHMNFLEPSFKAPPVGKWLFTVAHAGTIRYNYYEGKCCSLPLSVKRFNDLRTDFPNRFRFISHEGMDLCYGTSGAPITDSTGRVFGMQCFLGNNLDYMIPSLFIRYLNPDFLSMREKMNKEMPVVIPKIPRLRFPSNFRNLNSKYRESSSMVEMRDRFRSVTTQGRSAEKLDIVSFGIASTDVSRVREVIEKMTSIFEAYSGVKSSSREKPKGLETLKAESVKRSADQLTLQDLGGDEMDMSGNACPFDYSRVQRGIDQAFKKLRTCY